VCPTYSNVDVSSFRGPHREIVFVQHVFLGLIRAMLEREGALERNGDHGKIP